MKSTPPIRCGASWMRFAKARATVHEIVLAPLSREDLGRLLVDSLHCEPEQATPLAQLVHEKTGGNPFFAIQFISALVEEELLTFNHDDARWFWDLSRIHAKGYTDNVVDLMVGKLNRLPSKPRRRYRSLPVWETAPRSPRFPSFTGHRRTGPLGSVGSCSSGVHCPSGEFL